MELTGCPWDLVTPDVTAAIQAARQEARGHWPVEGGWLDQTQSCLDAVELVRALDPAIKE